MMLAAMAGNASVIEYLLSVGAAVDPVNDFGESALALAAAAGHPGTVQILLKAGALGMVIELRRSKPVMNEPSAR